MEEVPAMKLRSSSSLDPIAALDNRVSTALFHTGTGVPRPLWKCLEYTGDGIVWLAITVMALLTPLTPPAHRTLWANFFLGLLLDLVEVGLLKGLIRRSRPSYNALAKDMVVVVAVDHYSFPSGHSSR